MDHLLGGRQAPKQTSTQSTVNSLESQKVTPSKSSDSGESEKRRVKVTYYLPADLVGRIDDAHYRLNKAARESDTKIKKYDMARVVWEMALEEFEQYGEQSELAARMLSDS
jgi:hypothetical protein